MKCVKVTNRFYRDFLCEPYYLMSEGRWKVVHDEKRIYVLGATEEEVRDVLKCATWLKVETVEATKLRFESREDLMSMKCLLERQVKLLTAELSETELVVFEVPKMPEELVSNG